MPYDSTRQYKTEKLNQAAASLMSSILDSQFEERTEPVANSAASDMEMNELSDVPVQDGHRNDDKPNATPATEQSNQSIREENAPTKQELDEQQLRQERDQHMRMRRMHIENALYDVSYYGYILSWVFLALFIVGKLFANIPALTLVGVIGSLISISASMIAGEVIEKRHRTISMARAAIVSLGALAFAASGLVGLATSSPDMTAAGVIGLFLWSFIPNLIDFTKRQKDDYKTYEYDDAGNVISGGEDDGMSYRYSYSSSSGGYNAINEIFGIPQPQDPPPIEISRDDIDDEYDDKHILGVEVIMPNNPSQDIILVPIQKENEEESSNQSKNPAENDDTFR